MWDPLDGSRKVWVTAVAALPSTSHQRGAASREMADPRPASRNPAASSLGRQSPWCCSDNSCPEPCSAGLGSPQPADALTHCSSRSPRSEFGCQVAGLLLLARRDPWSCSLWAPRNLRVEETDQQPKGSLIKKSKPQNISGLLTTLQSLCAHCMATWKGWTQPSAVRFISSHIKPLHSCPVNHKARKQEVHSTLMKQLPVLCTSAFPEESPGFPLLSTATTPFARHCPVPGLAGPCAASITGMAPAGTAAAPQLRAVLNQPLSKLWQSAWKAWYEVQSH